MANENVRKRLAAKSHRQSDSKSDAASDVNIDAVVKAFHAARALPVSPLVKVKNNGDEQILAPAHPDPIVGNMLLKDATGGSDFMFRDGILYQLARSASKDGKVDEGQLNFMLSVVRSTKPKDQLEAMLAAQMAVVHLAMMPAHIAERRWLLCASTRPTQPANRVPRISL